MKIKHSIFLISAWILISCQGPPPKHVSFLKDLTDTMSISKKRNILIYSLNPNDCISCVNAFKMLNNTFSDEGNSCIYALPIDREIEKMALMKSVKDVDLNPQKNKVVIWSKEVFDKINAVTGKNLPLSLITIYSCQIDSVIYCKPVREIVDPREVKTALESGYGY